MNTLLLVEDDVELGQSIKKQLETKNFLVVWCQDFLAFERQSHLFFQAAIVDLNLPDGSGFDIVRKLDCPILLMTALNTPENRLESLELGVNDFIPKPFLFKELYLKLEKVLAKYQKVKVFTGVVVDFLSRRLEVPNQESVFLSDREFKVLKHLVDVSPKVVSRDELLDLVTDINESASHRSIDNLIVRLRQLLKDEAHQCIRSVRGTGYQWLNEIK